MPFPHLSWDRPTAGQRKRYKLTADPSNKSVFLRHAEVLVPSQTVPLLTSSGPKHFGKITRTCQKIKLKIPLLNRICRGSTGKAAIYSSSLYRTKAVAGKTVPT